jgi:hypothetical protein
MASSFIDFYIGYPGHPRFRDPELIEDDAIRVIVQKYEMILFTNKGEVFGEPNLGADLYELLHETRLSAESIQSDIISQINTYISEIKGIEHTVEVNFYDHPEKHEEYMTIDFTIAGYEVNAVVT